LKEKVYSKAVEQCNNALAIQPENVKALYRRGQAYTQLKEYADAVKDYESCKKIDPSMEKTCNKDIARTNALKKKYEQSQANIYRKLWS